MPDFRDRRVVLAIGAGLALAAGLGVAVIVASSGSKNPSQPPPASQGGLVVQTGRDDDVKLDPRRPLRCFVGGRFVGEIPLSECARRNGVATGALDVGLDPSGALAAANGPATGLTPLQPSPAPSASSGSAAPEAGPAPSASDAVAQPGERLAGERLACWLRGAGFWRKAPFAMSLDACVQSLYGGRCLAPGVAPVYGRWGDRTLRLVPGEVEISDDNGEFRTLAEQASDCSLPPISSPQ